MYALYTQDQFFNFAGIKSHELGFRITVTHVYQLTHLNNENTYIKRQLKIRFNCPQTRISDNENRFLNKYLRRKLNNLKFSYDESSI